jgi:multidrug efflux pump subunit AcrB/ABC-type multidrug transport system ATPase subunit
MGFLMLPVHRPVAVAMFFVGVMLLGGIAWQKMPVELFPSLLGDRISISFYRPGSEPEVIEREILLPLQAQVSTMSGVSETWGEIRGPNGRFDIRFESDVNIKVREFELERMVTEMRREQPQGTFMNVQTSGTGSFSELAMQIHVLGSGAEDRDALFDLVEQLVAPRFAAISGVSQAVATGGARRQVTVTVDPDRTTAVGLTTQAVTTMVQRTVGRMAYVGDLESEAGRTAVMVDGRPIGVNALTKARIGWDSPALLEHVSDVEIGTGREERLFRVNGQSAVGLVIFQEQGANLVRLGRTLRERIEVVRKELESQGLDLVIGFDAAETIEDQISHLSKLGASGFAIALVVLYFFLKQWRAVAVVGLAVPVSLLAALALLYITGQTLNLVSLFGLMLAIGLVIDNSVVVFEAIQRRLERGLSIEHAVSEGLRRTVRAILAASATTAVVFLPLLIVELDDEMQRQMIKVVSLSILLPLAASLMVAIGLVPLLASRLAAPAAESRLAQLRQRRLERGNVVRPDQARILFGGIVAAALRNPPALLAGTVAAVLITVITAIPGIIANNNIEEATEPDRIQLSAKFPSDRSINVASDAIAKLERVILQDPTVESVEANIELDGGQLTINFIDRDLRPEDFRAQTIRNTIRKAAGKIRGLEIMRPGDERGNRGGGGGKGDEEAFGGAAAEIVLSGPDSEVLLNLASSVEAQLESMPQIEDAWTSMQPGMAEYWIEPIHEAFESLGLTFSEVLPILNLAGQEGQQMTTGFVLQNGRELPLVVERLGARERNVGMRDLTRLRVQTGSGVMPVTSMATMRQMPPPTMISHHNGRREVSVNYRLRGDIPTTGATRINVQEQIAESIQAVPRPSGTAIETLDDDETTSLFQQVAVPAIGLLFLVLAMTFESLTLPILVLIALPLTILGAAWALTFAGISFSIMAMLGALVLVGLTVNPAILLVDRMQQLIREGGWSIGAAAFAAVRERTRPVLMTSATTIAGLWPLAITTGRENEIWPPFATVVIGGLITSTLLTLLIMPVGFILLRRVDQIFGRVGPWLVLAWMGSTAAIMASLILSETITSLLWQSVVTLLTGSALLAVVVVVFRPREIPEPDCSNGPPTLEVKYLHKTYGLPGALKAALLAPERFTRKVMERGGSAFLTNDARERLVPLGLATVGVSILAYLLRTSFWQLFFWLIAGVLLSRFFLEVRRFRGHASITGNIEPGGIENRIAFAIPWLIIAVFTWLNAVSSHLAGFPKPGTYIVCILAAVVVAAFQGMRRSARRQSSGEIAPRVNSGGLGFIVNIWRSWSARVAGLDLPSNPIRALDGVSFTVERGMIGILGPNGAGKTTLLRQLAGVMNPTRGTIRFGGVQLSKIQRHLARWVGYLPQDAGLPEGMSPKEYLTWYAALYDIPPDIREQRVDSLLEEVGLAEKTNERIKALSGGMRQRVAVARTLLRLPPVIIVDEPTVGLDPRERIRFRNLLSRLARDRIVLMSTHVVEDVAVACDRVLVFSKGELVFDGGTDTLADTANGHVWEVRKRPDDAMSLPQGSIHTHETPAADGSVIHRIIAEHSPDETAQSLDATLEDGYMWLLSKIEHQPEAAPA